MTSTPRVTDENVSDIVDTAAYGGITYWAVEPTRAEFDAKPEGAEWTIVDGEGHTEEGRKAYYLSIADVRAAYHKLRDGRVPIAAYIQDQITDSYKGWSAAYGIDADIDAAAADAIVQVACFGEVVYG